MNHKFKLTQPTLSDYDSIISLFISADQRHQRSKLYYKYTNYSELGNATCVVVKNEKKLIVGHYSILPLEFKYRGKIYKVGFAQQAIIHKKYRDLKLITMLHDYAIKTAKKDLDLDLVFAFSNDNFSQIKTTLFGWQDLGKFSASVLDLNLVDFACNYNVESLGLNVFENNFDNAYDRFSLVKSMQYLNHKLLNHPISHFQTFVVKDDEIIVGYISLKMYYDKDNLVGHFIDFESKDELIIKSLIAKAKEYFIFYGVSKVVFWNNSSYREVFNPYLIGEGFKTNFIVYDYDNNIEILDKDVWNLSMILSDAF
jgi:hypothetical protein